MPTAFGVRLWLKAGAFMVAWSAVIIYLFKDVDVTLNGETKKGLVPRFILTISCECFKADDGVAAPKRGIGEKAVWIV